MKNIIDRIDNKAKEELLYNIIVELLNCDSELLAKSIISSARLGFLDDKDYIDFLRDFAISIEDKSLTLSMLLMKEAYLLRPTGAFICQKLVSYSDRLNSHSHVVYSRAYLLRSLFNTRKKVLMERIAKCNADLELNDGINFKSYDRSVVTVVSPVAHDPFDTSGKLVSHFMSVMGYAMSIAASNEFLEVNIVFTREWMVEMHSLDIIDLESKLTQAKSFIDCSNEVLNKISFRVLYDPMELPKYLKGTILKLKSVAEYHSSYIYDVDLYDNFPVVTGTFNSHFNKSENNDYLLVRSPDSVSEDKALYVPPSLYKMKPESCNSNCKRILTAYTSDRLVILLNSLSDSEWSDLEELFSLGYVWVLSGYSNPDVLMDCIPNEILERYPNSIETHKYLDLDVEFEKTYALLTSPLFRGAGGTARIAISNNVPVISCNAHDSDVATILPSENLCKSFIEQLQLIKCWATDNEKYKTFLSRQRKLFMNKTNLLTHQSHLPETIKDAIVKYESRTNC
ncbi:hypothetical protein [Vibrio sp. 10N.261.52.F3]|uniref:hypothetical protein n=1 Tax=Vibrio sp. 10N.261.52.F3 TaxID=3229683 RepID=UPI003553B65D